MDLEIKQLKQYNRVFVPQTTAEAVLVKEGTVVYTLDKVLEKKVEQVTTPAGSGLNSYKQGTSIIITHSNIITANDTPQSVKVKYDNRGHIVETAPVEKLNVIVDNEGYTQYNGDEERNLLFGDDFGIDQNKIALKWNNI